MGELRKDSVELKKDFAELKTELKKDVAELKGAVDVVISLMQNRKEWSGWVVLGLGTVRGD